MSATKKPEAEVFDPFTAPAATKTIVLAAAYTDQAGAAHKADATVELDRDEADTLLHAGRARTPEQDAVQRAEAEQAADTDAGTDPSDKPADILAAVGEDLDKARTALEAEQAKGTKARKKLVSDLEAIIHTAGNGNGPEGI